MNVRTMLLHAGALGAIATALACSDGSSGDGRGSNAIGNGHKATDFPEAVFVDVYRGGQLAGQCSGAVIAPRVVLTAGHCLDGKDEWRVRAPYLTAKTLITTRAMTFDWKNENTAHFNRKHHDVGLVILDEPLTLASYPTLAAKLKDGTGVVNVGRVDNGTFSQTDMFASTANTASSAKAHGYPLMLTLGKVASERGDGGGPVVLDGKTPHQIVGVIAGTGKESHLEYVASVLDGALATWIETQIKAFGGTASGTGDAGGAGSTDGGTNPPKPPPPSGHDAGSPPPPPPPPPHDAGSPAHDAGAPQPDAGTTSDAGTIARDDAGSDAAPPDGGASASCRALWETGGTCLDSFTLQTCDDVGNVASRECDLDEQCSTEEGFSGCRPIDATDASTGGEEIDPGGGVTDPSEGDLPPDPRCSVDDGVGLDVRVCDEARSWHVCDANRQYRQDACQYDEICRDGESGVACYFDPTWWNQPLPDADASAPDDAGDPDAGSADPDAAPIDPLCEGVTALEDKCLGDATYYWCDEAGAAHSYPCSTGTTCSGGLCQ